MADTDFLQKFLKFKTPIAPHPGLHGYTYYFKGRKSDCNRLMPILHECISSP